MDARLTSLESLQVAHGEVTEVTLTGPGKGNALGPAFWREAPEVARALDDDPDVRAIVLRGAGGNFTYGLDLPAMAQELGPLLATGAGGAGAAERTLLQRQAERMQQACDGWARCRKPVIAAMEGWCIGGGMNLAAAGDVRLCSAGARFSLREIRLAIVADLGALQRLPEIVGEGHARQLALTGEDFDAARAERIGWVNAVLPTAEALYLEARRLAETMAGLPPLTVQGVKQVMNANGRARLDDGLRLSALWSAAFLPSQDFNEALAAFLERRPPRFSGK